MKHITFYSSLIALCACANGNFVRSYELNQFKVIALLADKPEVSLGETVQITPYLSDLTGQGRSITMNASACIDPGVGVGAEPSCDQDPNKVILANQLGLGGLSAPYYTEATTSFAVTIPSTDLFSQIPPDLQFNGVNYLISVDFFSGTEKLERAFRRIVVSTRPTKNTNPVFQPPSIMSQGLDLTTLDAEKKISAQVEAIHSESFEEIRQGSSTTQQEKVLVYWFSSRGEFNFSSTNPNEETTWKPNEDNNSLPHVLIAVVRDGRGGVGVAQKNF